VLLHNLGPEYDGFVSSTLQQVTDNKEPNLEMICSRLLDEACHRIAESGKEIALLSSQSKNSGGAQKRYCNFCKKPGHSEDRCWKQHPDQQPAWIKKRNESASSYLTEETLMALENTGCQSDVWLLDSDASSHMCNNCQLYKTYTKVSRKNLVGTAKKNSTRMDTIGVGSLELTFQKPDSTTYTRVINQVWHISELV